MKTQALNISRPKRATITQRAISLALQGGGAHGAFAWGVLDTHLAGRTHVVGERLTIADLSLCGYLFWPDEIGVDWAGYPNIAAWLGRIRGTPRWSAPYALMPGHPLPAKA